MFILKRKQQNLAGKKGVAVQDVSNSLGRFSGGMCFDNVRITGIGDGQTTDAEIFT